MRRAFAQTSEGTVARFGPAAALIRAALDAEGPDAARLELRRLIEQERGSRVEIGTLRASTAGNRAAASLLPDLVDLVNGAVRR